MKFANMIAFGVAPHAIGNGYPEGIIGGVHSNYYFNYPPANRWPLNATFIKKSFGRWKEYPNLPFGRYLYLDVNLQPCSQNLLQGFRRWGGPRQDHPCRRSVSDVPERSGHEDDSQVALRRSVADDAAVLPSDATLAAR
jgi:hypothetical protein